MIELHVAADDRTGALETAAACADAGFRAVCVPWSVEPPAAGFDVVVADLGTRHVGAATAARRARQVREVGVARAAHKIDSTLRGNWARELAARAQRCAVVAAFPAAGRTCVDGVMLDHGIPVADGHAGRDVRMPVHWSRPADHLAAARAGRVAHARDAAALDAWIAGTERFVVVDAADDGALGEAVALIARRADILLAGSAAAIGALARSLAPAGARRVAVPPVRAPVLVVVGSQHPVALDQLVRLEADLVATGRTDVSVLRAPAEPRNPRRVLAALAGRAQAARRAVRPASLVVIGGDTAAAVLGDAPMIVEGTHGTGVARCRFVDDDLVVLTRPGGFGGPDALVELVGPA